jgi:hypothetical protein
MKPIKSLVPLAKWLLRIAALGIIYKEGHFDTAVTFSFNGLSYFIALLSVIFVIMLFIGGFLKNSNLTVVSGLLILTLSLIILFAQIGFSIPGLLSILPLGTIGFYFMARGNLG